MHDLAANLPNKKSIPGATNQTRGTDKGCFFNYI